MGWTGWTGRAPGGKTLLKRAAVWGRRDREDHELTEGMLCLLLNPEDNELKCSQREEKITMIIHE